MHEIELRVYHEDTDLAGLVYYANYFRFIERARSEMLRSLRINQTRLLAEEGLAFVVRKLSADYISPARFDDRLQVKTRVIAAERVRIDLEQTVDRDGKRLFLARVQLALIGKDGRPRRIPEHVTRSLTDKAA